MIHRATRGGRHNWCATEVENDTGAQTSAAVAGTAQLWLVWRNAGIAGEVLLCPLPVCFDEPDIEMPVHGQINTAAQDRSQPVLRAEVRGVEMVESQQRMREQVDSFASPRKAGTDRVSAEIVPAFVIRTEVAFEREIRMEVVSEREAEPLRHTRELERHNPARPVTLRNVPARIEPLIASKQVGFWWSLLLLGPNYAG